MLAFSVDIVGVFLVDDLIYIADGTDGLEIIRFRN